MLTTASFDYLKDLSKNNNREWFHANKKAYEKDLKKPFQNLVQQLIDTFQRHDPDIQIQPKEAIFRINRDIRFSKDKTPYKTHVSAIISPKGRKGKEYPGFYFHFEAGRLMMGGGAYFLGHTYPKGRICPRKQFAFMKSNTDTASFWTFLFHVSNRYCLFFHM